MSNQTKKIRDLIKPFERLAYYVPFEMVTRQRSCDKKPEQAALSLWLGEGRLGGSKQLRRVSEWGEDKTTYGQGLLPECCHLVEL